MSWYIAMLYPHNLQVITWSAVYARSSFQPHIVSIYLIKRILCPSNRKIPRDSNRVIENKRQARSF